MDYKYYEEKVGISTSDLFQIVSDEEIVREFTGEIIREGERICSPLRIDRNPGCWWQRMENGRLYFRDFAGERKPLNSVEFVWKYNGYKSYKETLKILFHHFVLNKTNGTYTISDYKRNKYKIIKFSKRKFSFDDEVYWDTYTLSNIKDIKKDNVVPIVKKFGNIYVQGYCFYEFKPRYKLYFPSWNDCKFLAKTIKDDIGNIRNIDDMGTYLIITKSYKDARALRTFGLKNVIYFQSENSFPDVYRLRSFIIRFDKIHIMFDNDRTGNEYSFKLSKTLTMLGAKYVYRHFVDGEDIKDISDFIMRDKVMAYDFLNNIFGKYKK